MKLIGLTGGISSGKSTVMETLANEGAIILDADKIAHRCMEKGSAAWQDIIAEFGQNILNDDGSINRGKLGKIVFADSKRRQRLNEITHPRVFEQIKRELKNIEQTNPQAAVIIEIPLLYESNRQDMFDEVWVVWVDRETQIQRLMSRNGYTRAEAIQRINSQLDLDKKAQLADRVINNSSHREETIRLTRKYFNAILNNR